MKLFLASLGLVDNLMPYVSELVDSTVVKKKALVITNASEHRDSRKQEALLAYNKILYNYNIDYSFLDLKDYGSLNEELRNRILSIDFIWVPGGDPFVLIEHFNRLALKPLLDEFLARGKVYGGGSAGAMITGPSMEGFDYADTTDKKNLINSPGLGLVNFVVVPHVNSSRMFAKELKLLKDKSIYKVYGLNDDQAIIVNDKNISIAS